MIAGHQQDGRALAMGDRRDRDRDPAVSGAVHRMRQAQKPGLLALALEIDFRGKAAPHGWHVRLPGGAADGGRLNHTSHGEESASGVTDAAFKGRGMLHLAAGSYRLDRGGAGADRGAHLHPGDDDQDDRVLRPGWRIDRYRRSPGRPANSKALCAAKRALRRGAERRKQSCGKLSLTVRLLRSVCNTNEMAGNWRRVQPPIRALR
jgi:hypothetical protein